MDNIWDQVIRVLIVLVSVSFGYLVSIFKMRWQKKELKKDAIRDRRMKVYGVYGEGSQFVYDVEQNRTNAQELEHILDRWRKWYLSNSIYFSPSVNDSLFGALHWTLPVMIDLNNNQSDAETLRIFEEHLQKAKRNLMDLKDIGWLPEDLK